MRVNQKQMKELDLLQKQLYKYIDELAKKENERLDKITDNIESGWVSVVKEFDGGGMTIGGCSFASYLEQKKAGVDINIITIK